MFGTESLITWYSSTGIFPYGFGLRDVSDVGGAVPVLAAPAATAPDVCVVAPPAAVDEDDDERSPHANGDRKATIEASATRILLRMGTRWVKEPE